MDTPNTFKVGDRVRKIKGSQWQGVIVGTYATELTPDGFCVESEREKGSVQLYPAYALESVPPQVNEAKEICEQGFKQGECMNHRCPFYFAHTIKKPAPDAWADIEEEFNKTKFAKGGGSSFECSDYEGMDTELRAFLKKHIEKARLQGKYDELAAHRKSEAEAYEAGCQAGGEAMKAKAIAAMPSKETISEGARLQYREIGQWEGKEGRIEGWNACRQEVLDALIALSLTETPE